MNREQVDKVNELYSQIDDLTEQLHKAQKSLQWNRDQRKKLERHNQELEKKLSDRDRWAHIPDDRLIRVEQLLEQLRDNSVERLLSSAEPQQKG